MVHTGDPDAIEFSRMFATHAPGQLTLTGALRINATFPYITPVVTMPSEPPMRLMDAGMRDNYGYRVTLSFLRTFREWIATNTSGVVILQLRDTPKGIGPKPTGTSLLGRLFSPMGNVYDNVVRVQDLDYDLMLQQASTWADFPINLVDLELHRPEEERISLSWHLTALERKRVFRSMDTHANQHALQRLHDLIDGSSRPPFRVPDDSGPTQAMDPAPPR